jgi:hypothetical protein
MASWNISSPTTPRSPESISDSIVAIAASMAAISSSVRRSAARAASLTSRASRASMMSGMPPETGWDWVRLVDGTAINTGTDRLVPARGHQSAVTAVFGCVRFPHPASRRTACRGLHLVCPGGRRSYRTECLRTLRARTGRGARPWYSPEGSAVPGGVPVPRWSWDGLVGR